MKIPSKLNSYVRKSRLEKEIDQTPIKNPKFNVYRNTILERPSHYNSSLTVAAEGGAADHNEIELTE